ncbi:MAG: sensor histidine kinase [Pseudobdellovibrionaceae bacterium]
MNQIAVAVERLRFVDAAQQKIILEASEKLHQALINSVSHELRTPITALIGTSTALRDEKTLADKKAREALTEDLVNSAHRLDRVVENLLDMSRLEKGTLQLKKEWFEVHDLVDEVKDSLGNEAKNIQASGDLNVLINGDFRLLRHSLYNIVANALKYAGSVAPVEIQVHKSGRGLEVSVIDGGPGVPVALEDQIFDKFYRLPGSPAGGLGLGLSIVKSIIELHGGGISVKSREDGKRGAHFSVWLPLEPTPPELTEALK